MVSAVFGMRLAVAVALYVNDIMDQVLLQMIYHASRVSRNGNAPIALCNWYYELDQDGQTCHDSVLTLGRCAASGYKWHMHRSCRGYGECRIAETERQRRKGGRHIGNTSEASAHGRAQ